MTIGGRSTRTRTVPARIGGLALLLLALAACSDDGGDGADGDGNAGGGDPEAFAAAEFLVSGADGELTDPAQDDSVTLGAAGGEVAVFGPGDTLTVSIAFEAPEGNVVGAGIRFGDSGPITVVPFPSMAGATSGTLNFDVQVPLELCDELGSICHDIRCYEFAVTDAGLVSAANLTQMASSCGGCDTPSCKGLLPGCPDAPAVDVPAVDVPDDFCVSAEPEPLMQATSLGGVAVDDQYVYFTRDAEILRMAKQPGAAPEVLVADAGSPRELLLLDGMLYYEGFNPPPTGLFAVPVAGGTPERVGDGSRHQLATDGSAVYGTRNSALCIAENAILRAELGGAQTTLADMRTCGDGLAVDDSQVYWVDEVGDETFQVWRVPSAGGSPQALGQAGDLSGPLAADDTWLYLFGAKDGSLRRALARMDKQSGALEDLGGQYSWQGMLADPDGAGAYFGDSSWQGCVWHVDDQGQVRAVARNTWFIHGMAADATHLYWVATDVDLDNVLMRAPR